MISASSSGDTKNTEDWLRKMASGDIYSMLDRYGAEGVRALAQATPKESGYTASQWYYEIKRDRTSYSIIWGNSHVVNGTPVVIMLQYGHGTGTGGYVEGQDFINPALKPIFDRIARDVWKAVTAK